MKQTALRSQKISQDIRSTELHRFIQGWLLDCQSRNLSIQTIALRRGVLKRLTWWMEREGFEVIGSLEIKAFLVYLANGHEEPGGRFGNPLLTSALRPRSIADFYGVLQTFFRFLVSEGYVDSSPMERVRKPVYRKDQIQPFTKEQVKALVSEAKSSKYRIRDTALILFLLDTGVRATELCDLRIECLDVVSRKAIVLGKGNKHRAVYFSRETGRALWKYLRSREFSPEDPVFQSENRGAFTRSGLRQLVERLGKRGKVEAVQCSPHTFRHTFAVMFLRNGGNVFTLKELLGHTDLAMTNRYVAIASADIENQHRLFSPVDSIKGGR